MEELLKDRSTPIWVLELGHQLKEIDIVDAINGLEAVTDARVGPFFTSVPHVRTLRPYLYTHIHTHAHTHAHMHTCAQRAKLDILI